MNLARSHHFYVGEEPRIETKADSQVLLTQSMILMFLSVDTKLFPFANEISITMQDCVCGVTVS